MDVNLFCDLLLHFGRHDTTYWLLKEAAVPHVYKRLNSLEKRHAKSIIHIQLIY